MSEVLWAQYKRDPDRQARERLVESYRALVASVSRRLLRDPADVEDVVQETRLKLAANIDTVNGPLAVWLTATARAASVDLIRRCIRGRVVVNHLWPARGPGIATIPAYDLSRHLNVTQTFYVTNQLLWLAGSRGTV